MKSKVYRSPLFKMLVFGLFIVMFSLSVTSQTQAQNASANTGLAKSTIALVSIGKQNALRIMNAPGSRARLLRILANKARLDPKSVKLVSGGCGCTVAAQEQYGLGSCMAGCLKDAGASYYALIMCGGSCTFGIVPVCALCVGLTVAVVEACAIGCLMFPGPYHPAGLIAVGGVKSRHATSGSLQAKLRLQTAKGKT